MSAVESLLPHEKAIALRLIRSQAVPHDFWLWLGGLSSIPLDNVGRWIDTSVQLSIQEITEPNLTDADVHERVEYARINEWIAAILGFANRRASELSLSCGNPMTAASLLPLYRSLATRKFPEALEQTRNRLAEMLVFVGIAQELGDDFVQLLNHRGAPVTSPYVILKSSLQFDLTAAGSLVRQAARLFDPRLGQFRLGQFDEGLAKQSATSTASAANRELAWSDPQLLWQIVGEFMAKKAQIVLPRQWAEVAVPWTSISDHWNSLSQRLTQQATTQSANAALANAPKAMVDGDDESSELGADDALVCDMIDNVLAMQSDVSEAGIKEDPDAEADDIEFTAKFDETAESNLFAGRAHAAHDIGSPLLEPSQSESEEEEFPETDSLDDVGVPAYSKPKIALVKIASNADAIFVSIVRRQIATARSEERNVCLVALCVESDDTSGDGELPSRSNGLTIWQEKLVDWLAGHPHVHEPCAFVTSDGQLVVSMLDVERTVATNVIRGGLVTALTGKSVDDQGSLSRVAIPFRYYGGIGSVSAPNASFAAEQLISATWRCLFAAQSQGKATIKSIEVY